MGTISTGVDKFIDLYTKTQKRKYDYEKEQTALKGEIMKEKARRKAERELAGYKSELRTGEELAKQEFKMQNPSIADQQAKAIGMLKIRAATKARRYGMDSLNPQEQKLIGGYVKPDETSNLSGNIPYKPSTQDMQAREKRSLFGVDQLWPDKTRPVGATVQSRMSGIESYQDVKEFLTTDFQEMMNSGNPADTKAAAEKAFEMLSTLPPEKMNDFIENHVPTNVVEYLFENDIIEEE